MVKKIVQISDLHTRFTRQEEYKTVFKNLYDKLEEIKPELIVFTGDAVDTKTSLSPEQISLTSDFFRGLSGIAPLIIIPGNHDGLVRNESRMDALTPIINGLNSDNITYLRDSVKYTYDDEIDFYHVSVFDREFNIVTPDDKNKVNIFLYHGTFEGCILQNGKVIEQSRLKREMLSDYDVAMLGDIHKEQTVIYNNCIIRQAGSLIQQNFGEEVLGHGFTLWKVSKEKTTYSHIEVESDYKFYNIKFEDDKLITDIDVNNLVKFSSLKIRYKNTKISTIDEFLSKTGGVYKVYLEDLSVKKMDIDSEIDKQIIDDVEYQNKVIEESNLAPESMLNEIKELNKEINEKTTRTDIQKANIWSIKNLKFMNMFSYSGDIENEIDFSNMSGLIGIFGKNFQGKSSIFNIISYALFDRCEKSNLIREIVNFESDSFYTKIEILNGNTSYFVERSGERKEKTFPVNVEFYKIENGEKIDLAGSQRRETNKNITNIVGTYEDFILTTFSVQNDFTGMLSMKQSETKDMLYRFFNLEYFDKLLKIAKEDLKTIEVLHKKVESEQYEDKISHYKNVSQHIKSKIDSLVVERKDLETKIAEIESEKELLISKLPNIDDVKNINIDDLKEQFELYELKLEKTKIDILKKRGEALEIKDSIKYNIDELTNLREKNRSEYKELQSQILPVSKLVDLEKLKSYISEEKNKDFSLIKKIEEELLSPKYNVKEEEFNKLKEDKKKNELELKEKKIELSNVVKDLSKKETEKELTDKVAKKLDIVEYDDNCPYCNNFVKDYVVAKNKLPEIEEGILKHNNLKNNLDEEISAMEKRLLDLLSQIEEINNDKRDKKDLELELSKLNNEKEASEVYVKRLEQEILDGELSNKEAEDSKQKNETINGKIRVCEMQYEQLLREAEHIQKLDKLINEEEKLKNDKDRIEIKINEISFKLSSLKSKEEEIKQHKELSSKIDLLRYNEKNARKDLDKVIEDIHRSKSEVESNKEKIKEVKSLITERAMLLEKVNLYKAYCKVVDKNGLPYHIIKNIIPIIQNDANAILKDISEYELIFELEESNINIYINYDGKLWSISTASGMEKFAASIALRVALSNNTNLSRGNFLMIDEGFSTLDAEHLADVSNVLKSMSHYFDKIFIISHLEFINDIVDERIIITRDESGISQINM